MKKTLIISMFTVSMIISSLLMESFVVPTVNREPLTQTIPKGFPIPVYTYKNNPLSREGFELGRKLFYDGRLSRDGVTSCASCHQQFAGFADFEHPLSHGFNSAFSFRNAPGLSNLAWQKAFHYDGGINHIEVQPLAPITDTSEMATSIDAILLLLSNDKEYRRMFSAAFGSTKISSQHLLKALAQFTGMLVSADSKYDRVIAGKTTFTQWEQKGYDLFMVRCAGCHTPPLFTDQRFRNIGQPVDTFFNDYGRMRITGNQEDSLKFKVPSLRNVAITAPYMHDGRIFGLSVALDHSKYARQNDHRTDSLILRAKLLDRQEVQYLSYFLRTLTDSSFLKDTNFSDPSSKRYQHLR